jgi:ribonuclease-3
VSARGRWAEAQLQYKFKDSNLLDLALTHRNDSCDYNERLEYLRESFMNYTIEHRRFELRREDT